VGRLLIVILLALTALAASADAQETLPPTTAAFTFSPLAPRTGQPVHFDGSGSNCLQTPCTYTWTDQPPGGGVWPLGTGKTLDFTFHYVGTKYVNLTVRDARGRTAGVEHDVIVSAAPPPDDTPPPTPPAPTAAFSYSPQSPTTGQEVTFDASISTCNATPCSYAWEDDGPDGAGGTQWPLGSGQKLKFTFSGEGTKYARLTVTDALGRKDTVEHDVTVGSTPPPPPPAAQCADGKDNDNDGKVDMADPGCSSSSDNDETDPAPSPPPSGDCDLHATTSNFSSVFASGDGKTICLASGNYGAFNGGIKSAMTTIRPEDGATVTMALHFDPAANITVDGVKIATDPATGLGAFLNQSRTHDITVRNSVFDQKQAVMRTDSLPSNANILFDHNVHSNFVACSSCYEGRVEVVGVPRGSDGITIQNSEFYGGNSDGIQNGGNGTRILNNEFHDIKQIDGPQGVHADSIQLVDFGNTVVRGNYFHDVSIGIMAADGADHETIENNVFKVNGSPYAVTVESDNGSVIRHNTLWGGATCAFNIQCGVLYVGNKSGDPVSTGTKITDNILTRVCVCAGSSPQNQTEDYNLIAGQTGAGAHDIRGVPIYTGGISPIALADFALTAISPGHAAADDGSDIGAAIGP
jgi:hypothetical protein